MNQIKTNRIEEITRLHNELTGLLMNSLEKRRETEEKLRKSRQKIEYAKEYPEKVGIGKVRYEKTKAGYTLRITTTGQINGLPITKPECFDPEYIELEENKASYDLSFLLGEAIREIKGAVRNSKRMYKKYPGKIKSAYDHNWTDGKRDLYPELKRAYEELKKIMESIG